MKFAHKLNPCPAGGAGVVLSLCNTVLIGQQFRQELHNRAGNVICRLAAGKPRHATNLGHPHQR